MVLTVPTLRETTTVTVRWATMGRTVVWQTAAMISVKMTETVPLEMTEHGHVTARTLSKVTR